MVGSSPKDQSIFWPPLSLILIISALTLNRLEVNCANSPLAPGDIRISLVNDPEETQYEIYIVIPLPLKSLHQDGTARDANGPKVNPTHTITAEQLARNTVVTNNYIPEIIVYVRRPLQVDHYEFSIWETNFVIKEIISGKVKKQAEDLKNRKSKIDINFMIEVGKVENTNSQAIGFGNEMDEFQMVDDGTLPGSITDSEETNPHNVALKIGPKKLKLELMAKKKLKVTRKKVKKTEDPLDSIQWKVQVPNWELDVGTLNNWSPKHTLTYDLKPDRQTRWNKVFSVELDYYGIVDDRPLTIIILEANGQTTIKVELGKIVDFLVRVQLPKYQIQGSILINNGQSLRTRVSAVTDLDELAYVIIGGSGSKEGLITAELMILSNSKISDEHYLGWAWGHYPLWTPMTFAKESIKPESTFDPERFARLKSPSYSTLAPSISSDTHPDEKDWDDTSEELDQPITSTMTFDFSVSEPDKFSDLKVEQSLSLTPDEVFENNYILKNVGQGLTRTGFMAYPAIHYLKRGVKLNPTFHDNLLQTVPSTFVSRFVDDIKSLWTSSIEATMEGITTKLVLDAPPLYSKINPIHNPRIAQDIVHWISQLMQPISNNGLYMGITGSNKKIGHLDTITHRLHFPNAERLMKRIYGVDGQDDNEKLNSQESGSVWKDIAGTVKDTFKLDDMSDQAIMKFIPNKMLDLHFVTSDKDMEGKVNAFTSVYPYGSFIFFDFEAQDNSRQNIPDCVAIIPVPEVLRTLGILTEDYLEMNSLEKLKFKNTILSLVIPRIEMAIARHGTNKSKCGKTKVTAEKMTRDKKKKKANAKG